MLFMLALAAAAYAMWSVRGWWAGDADEDDEPLREAAPPAPAIVVEGKQSRVAAYIAVETLDAALESLGVDQQERQTLRETATKQIALSTVKG